MPAVTPKLLAELTETVSSLEKATDRLNRNSSVYQQMDVLQRWSELGQYVPALLEEVARLQELLEGNA